MTIEKILELAERLNNEDPHLANYTIRDLPIIEELGLKELVWSMHQQGYCTKAEVNDVIEKIRNHISNSALSA